MSKIIFDIETIANDFDSLDAKDQEYLLKFAETPEKQSEEKLKLALYPSTSWVVAIGLLNPETMKGKVYFQANNENIQTFEENNIMYQVADEKQIFENFWEDIRNFHGIITFNGNGFDVPYVMLRSAMLNVKPSKNLNTYRYEAEKHCDLMDQLNFYGSTRRFSLDWYCKMFGIKSPKEEVSGLELKDLYAKGEYLKIAKYNAGDLIATAELYKKWDEFINI